MKRSMGKAAVIFLIAAVLAASVVRFFQYMSLVDFSSGFFARGSEFGGVLIYAVMAAVFAVYIWFCFSEKSREGGAFSITADTISDGACRVLGVSYVIAGMIKVFGVSFSNFDMFQIFGVVTAAALALAGGLLFGGRTAVAGHLNAIAAIYYFFSAANAFNADLIVKHHSDNLILLLALIALSMHFASVPRFFVKAEWKKSRMRELITAGAAFVLSGTHVLPKLMAYAFGGSAVSGMKDINMDAAAGAVLSIAFIAVMLISKEKKTAAG